MTRSVLIIFWVSVLSFTLSIARGATYEELLALYGSDQVDVFEAEATAFLSANLAEPQREEIAFLLLRHAYKHHGYDKAIDRGQEYRTRYPAAQHQTEADFMLAHSAFELENYAGAAEQLTRYLESYPAAENREFALWVLAEAYRRGGDTEGTIPRLREYLVAYPDTANGPRARVYLARCYLDQRLSPAEAKVNLVQDFSSYPTADRAALAHHAIAKVFAERGQFASARPWCEEFVRQYPASADIEEIQYILANSLHEEADFEAQHQLLQPILTQRPAHAFAKELKYFEARAYQKEHVWDRAVEAYLDLEEAQPDSTMLPKILFYGGKSLMNLALSSRSVLLGEDTAIAYEQEGKVFLARFLELPDQDIDDRLEALHLLKDYDGMDREAEQYLSGHGVDRGWFKARMWQGMARMLKTPPDLDGAIATLDAAMATDFTTIDTQEDRKGSMLSVICFWRAMAAYQRHDRWKLLECHNFCAGLPDNERKQQALQSIALWIDQIDGE